jgi:FkbH-like protein
MISNHPDHLDYQSLLQASKHLHPSTASQKLRVALLSDAAAQRFEPLLRALFSYRGVDASIYTAPFGAMELEAYNAGSEMYRFQPDVIAVLNAVQALRADFGRRKGDALAFVNETAARITRVWEAVHSHIPAVVIQSNFVLPYERFFGNFDHKAPESFYAAVSNLNGLIAQAAREHRSVFINDVEAVASWVGRRSWFDDRFWDLAKSLCAQEYLPAVAANVVDIAMAARGQTIKCIVLDLDNTLWGGVIGDDGLEHIQLSEHGDGEAFYRLQCYLRELHRRGILLAVCSKNDPHNALLPFEKHPEMVLKRDHIAVFVANWNDKADNIRKIRETLNISLDSMVFLDDNPFERNMVRELLPGIVAPELPEDPADYVRAICELNLFETISFSEEDARRTELYSQESRRKEAAARFDSVDAFLESLDMRITVARFDSLHLPRIAQLIQRSNQFNLTTWRLSEAECESLMKDARWIPLYAKLADRLGDHGLISVVILERCEDEVVIREWLMSCRVLARGVEQFLMTRVFEEARRLGVKRVTGQYIPTAKNGMVEKFFAQFGFSLVEDRKGQTSWALTPDAYQPSKTYLQPAREQENAATAV